MLPPFQRLGLGARLLDTVYSHYRFEFYYLLTALCSLLCSLHLPSTTRSDRTVTDITVEDPSDNFVRLRDFVDTRNCLQLAAFGKAAVAAGFTEAMAEAARAELKICRKQARRVYEIVRLHHTSLADKQQYKEYRWILLTRSLFCCQDRHQAAAERAIPEGAEPAGEAAEGPEAGGVRRRHGQRHQQVRPFVLVYS